MSFTCKGKKNQDLYLTTRNDNYKINMEEISEWKQ